MPLFFAALVVLAAPATAPIGDGSALGLLVGNPGVHPTTAELGSADGPGLTVPLPGYGEVRARIQCAGRTVEALPGLAVTVDGRATPIQGQPVAFPDGAPALWISTARQGRAALAKRISAVRGPTSLKHLEPKAVPEGFEALRFAPLIIADGVALAALTPEARRAVQGAVAAGGVLVVAVGAADAPGSALDGFAPTTLGGTGPVGPALGAALPRATAVRAVTTGAGASPRVVADGGPVVVTAPLGLGEVRVLAVGLGEVDAGPVAQAAFGPGPDGFGQVLSWLDRAPPLGDSGGVRWSVWAWASLLVIPFLGLVYRRWPRLAVALAAPGWLAAVWAPPVDEALSVDHERVLVVPVGTGAALAVGTVDVTLGVGGGRTLPAGTSDVALEDARPQGACLVRVGDQAGFVLQGEPGGRRRIAWLARVPAPPALAPDGALPGWPAGPLAGAALAPIAAADLPAALSRRAADRVGWLAQPRPQPAPPAVTLEPPPPQ